MNVAVRARRRRTIQPRYTSHAGGVAGSDLIDLEVLLGILRDGRRLVLMVTLLCLVAMYAYLRIVPPSYQAHTEVILDTRQERATPVENVVSNLNVSNAVVAGEVISIRSNTMIGAVVDRLDLVNHPGFDPLVARPEYPIAWLKRTIRRVPPAHERARSFTDDQLRKAVIERILSDLSVTQIGISYAIRLSFTSHDPEAAGLVANEVARQYISSQLDMKAEVTSQANSWLSQRIEELSKQVESAEAAVVEFRTGMATQVGGDEETTAQLLSELNSQLVSTSADRADAEVRFKLVEALMESGGLAAVADVVTSPLLEALDRERATLEAERAELATTFGRLHPDMVHLVAQIDELDRSIRSETQRRVEAMRSDVQVAVSREEALKVQIGDISRRANELSYASVRLDQLERNAEATRAVYEEFLSRFKETSARGDFQLAEARLVGIAETPTSPAAPRKTLALAATGVFGVALGVAMVFLRSVLMAPVRTSRDLRRITGRPVLALVPHISSLFGKYRWLRRELAKRSGVSPFLESIRTLETHLLGTSPIRQPRVLMVTSSLAQEGKSTLCYALAKVMSDHGRRVVVLDADLRRPDSVNALQLSRTEGCLVEALSEEDITPRQLIKHSDLLDADVVAPVKATQNAVKLISKPAFSGIVTYLMTRYDIVLLNAPPAASLSDTLILSKFADATLLVVKSSAVPEKLVDATVTRLEDAGAHLEGAVFTQVRRGHLAGREVYAYAYY
ncbi:MAG: polysaccharide biosynthesis tyrosine autokinase [Pseudomonadota bacterium]